MTTDETAENANKENEKVLPSVEESLQESLKESLQECQEKYMRLLADSENARKRMQKERHELTKFAVENVLTEFLHPLDSFEKALKFAESMSEEVRNWAIGFEMILSQFKQILTDHGAIEYDSIGKHFDPHFHEAVEVVETDEYPPGIIIAEFVRGYRSQDRPIRVARVKVAKRPPASKDEDEKQD